MHIFLRFQITRWIPQSFNRK